MKNSIAQHLRRWRDETDASGAVKPLGIEPPSLLVSFIYVRKFGEVREHLHFRDWVMDSGAFTAHRSGVPIELDRYIQTCKAELAGPCPPSGIFALDVIGDWKATLKNTEKMWAAGVEAIPTFHMGSPWSVLTGIAKDYPKIAIGGMARKPTRVKDRFCAEVFARVWPVKIHGFGLVAEELLDRYPFHSIDAASWKLGPCGFGKWAMFKGTDHLARMGNKDLRSEVEYFLRLERRAKSRWAGEMKRWGEANAAPKLHLAVWICGSEAMTLGKHLTAS